MLDKLRFLLSGKLELRKQHRQNSRKILNIVLVLFVILGAIVILQGNLKISITSNDARDKFAEIINKKLPEPTPSATPSATPVPTPKPLTFAEMNSLYGPCVHLPVIFYHHIQTREMAVADKQTSLTVYTDVFRNQMQYLKDRGYNIATVADIINFFDNGTAIPARSVVLTFDDGYEDYNTDAFPILQNLGFRSTMFTITGLVNNPDYLTWDQIVAMNGLTSFANHTWSHKSLPTATVQVQQNEISLADMQLSQRGLNNPRAFAYPNGGYTAAAANYLQGLGYQIAFGTIPGSVLCKKQRFDLPRVRIGNSSLSNYGF